MKKNNKIKIAFFDIDWTLYDHGKNPKAFTKSSIKAIEKLRKNGIKVVLCTARAFASMLDIHTLEHLSVDGIISHNGGFIYIDNKKIRSSSLDGDFLEKFIKKTDSLGISVEIFTDFGAFSTLEPNEYVDRYHKFWDEKYSIVKKFDKNVDQCFSALVYAPEQYDEILFDKDFPYARVRFFETAVDVTYEPFYKGDGIKIVLDYFGFKKEEAIAFGDSKDDVSMFKEVGTSVAMGNAEQCAKDAATYITYKIHHHGVKHALKHFKLI